MNLAPQEEEKEGINTQRTEERDTEIVESQAFCVPPATGYSDFCGGEGFRAYLLGIPD